MEVISTQYNPAIPNAKLVIVSHDSSDSFKMRLVFYGFLLLTTANSRKVSFHCARSETSSAAKIRVFLQNAKNRFILTDLVKDGIPCLKLRNINDDNHEDANLHSTFGFLL